MKKTNALIIFAFILGLCPVYAADDDSSPAVVDKNTKEKIELLKNYKNFLCKLKL